MPDSTLATIATSGHNVVLSEGAIITILAVCLVGALRAMTDAVKHFIPGKLPTGPQGEQGIQGPMGTCRFTPRDHDMLVDIHKSTGDCSACQARLEMLAKEARGK